VPWHFVNALRKGAQKSASLVRDLFTVTKNGKVEVNHTSPLARMAICRACARGHHGIAKPPANTLVVRGQQGMWNCFCCQEGFNEVKTATAHIHGLAVDHDENPPPRYRNIRICNDCSISVPVNQLGSNLAFAKRMLEGPLQRVLPAGLSICVEEETPLHPGYAAGLSEKQKASDLHITVCDTMTRALRLVIVVELDSDSHSDVPAKDDLDKTIATLRGLREKAKEHGATVALIRLATSGMVASFAKWQEDKFVWRELPGTNQKLEVKPIERWGVLREWIAALVHAPDMVAGKRRANDKVRGALLYLMYKPNSKHLGILGGGGQAHKIPSDLKGLRFGKADKPPRLHPSARCEWDASLSPVLMAQMSGVLPAHFDITRVWVDAALNGRV
jgi:hypothetical protein